MPKINNLPLSILEDCADIDYNLVDSDHAIKQICLYRNNSTPKDVFERIAVLIEDKLHWLDIERFTLDDIHKPMECIGIAINTYMNRWASYPQGSFVVRAREKFVVTTHDDDVDLHEQLPEALRKLSCESCEDSMYWCFTDLALEYDLYEQEEYDEDVA